MVNTVFVDGKRSNTVFVSDVVSYVELASKTQNPSLVQDTFSFRRLVKEPLYISIIHC